jgi:SAM-dependent methyltransferase
MNSEPPFVKANRALWDDRVDIHMRSEFYNLEGFRKHPDSLKEIELAFLEDIRGKEILHLQCHFGQDSLSLAARGARVTGVDFSEKAIEAARSLSRELDLPATFICADVLQLDEHLDRQFDLVFTSYGVLGWLPDLQTWARQVCLRLKTGGRLVLVEFHPVVWMLDSNFEKFAFSYFNTGPIVEETTGTYTDRAAEIRGEEWSWNHSLSEIIGSLLAEGLELTQFREYDYSPWDCFVPTTPTEKGVRIKGLEGVIPMVFALEAVRKSS